MHLKSVTLKGFKSFAQPTTFDLPEPLGPTIAVTPGSKANVVGCANDLNPLSVTLFRCIASPPGRVDDMHTLPDGARGARLPRPQRTTRPDLIEFCELA